MPDSYAESAEGVVLVANGIDPVLKWDGYQTQAGEVGVVPPVDGLYVPFTDFEEAAWPGGGETVVIDGVTYRRGLDATGNPIGPRAYDHILLTDSGNTSPHVGGYYAYVRYIDDRGNPSNLSPVAGPFSPSLAGATVVGSDIVYTPGVFFYANVPSPVQGKVARRQILRNTAGQTRTFYVDVDTDDLQTKVFKSSRSDANLAAQEAVPILDQDGGVLANRYTVPPSTKPFLAFHLNRMWLAGIAAYAEGSCQVTRGSAAVTGVGTRWRQTFVGRFLYVLGGTRAYEVATVDEAAQTLTLTENYADDTDAFAQYAIKPPPGEAQSMYFSEAGLPEAWPATNAFTLPVDDDEVTGLLEFGSFLYVLKRRRMYKLTAQSDPGADGFIFYTLGRGCVNHRSWAIVEDMVYLLDEGGVYRFEGGSSAETISTPIQNLFRRNEAGAINWTAARYFHCNFDPQQETIRWFVSLNGEYLPRTALCYHYKTNKWWTERYPVPISASCTGRLGRPTGGWSDSGQVVYWGGPAGTHFTPDAGLDGVAADGATTAGTATAAGLDTLTDARAAFDTAWANVPVVITEGRGKGQERLVVSATATTLRVNEPWSVLPDATSKYQVGGIRYKFTGSRLRYAPGENQKGRSVEIQFVPQAEPIKVNLRIYQDFAVLPRKVGREVGAGQRPGVTAAPGGVEYVVDLSSPAGHFWDRFDGHREGGTNAPRLVAVELEGVSGAEPVRFGEMVLNGIVR